MGTPPQSFEQAFYTSSVRPKNTVLTMGKVSEHAGRYCLDLLGVILKEFTDELLMNPAGFGLNSSTELEKVVFKNIESEFTSARGRLAREFQATSQDMETMQAMIALDEGRKEVVESLGRKIRLHPTKTSPAPSPSIEIISSQNVNVILGSVDTSIQNLITKGGAEKDVARLIQDLVNAINNLEAKHETVKQELLKLADGLAKEIEKKPEGRNSSVIQAILDRIKTVGSTVSTAATLHKFITETLPQLARLLGIGG